MMLVQNWRQVLRYAWSIRLMAAVVLLSGAEVALQVLADDPPIDRGVFAAMSAATTIAAAIARLVAQPTVSGDPR